MALIKRADADSIAREAVTLHLGDLERQGETLVAEAEARAERILVKARAERDLLIAGAAERGYKAGYAKGHAEGMAKGREAGEAEAVEHTTATISALAEQWGLAMGRFEDARERMLSDARSDIVRLATLFAEKVARRVVELDDATVGRTLEGVLRRVVGPTALTVAVHPDDLGTAERLLPTMVDRIGGSSHASVIADRSIERGGCIVRTSGGGVIDADVRAQIARMVAVLLPDGERADADTADGGPDGDPGGQESSGAACEATDTDEAKGDDPQTGQGEDA